MDVSGDPESGNHKFMAIVMGRDERVRSLARRLGTDSIRMNMIHSKKERDRIIGNLAFDRTECIALCIRLEKKKTLERIRHARQNKNRYVDGMKLLRTYHYLAWRAIRVHAETFLHRHGCGVDEVVFQCDGDCGNFAKDLGLRHAPAGTPPMLADIVAWTNSHGREPSGTVNLDLADLIHEQMARQFK